MTTRLPLLVALIAGLALSTTPARSSAGGFVEAQSDASAALAAERTAIPAFGGDDFGNDDAGSSTVAARSSGLPHNDERDSANAIEPLIPLTVFGGGFVLMVSHAHRAKRREAAEKAAAPETRSEATRP
jgi:hypothetical protein